MVVQLPTVGEDPWGDELNSAISGIDARVTAVEGAAAPWVRWYGTQAQYDALVTKDPNTLYAVKG